MSDTTQPTKTFAEIRTNVIDVLKTCYDPEIPVDIYELGLIYEVNVDPANNVKVLMTLTSPTCPVAETLPPEVEQKIKGIEGIGDVKVELTWEPSWNQEMMSEAAKLELGFL